MFPFCTDNILSDLYLCSLDPQSMQVLLEFWGLSTELSSWRMKAKSKGYAPEKCLVLNCTAKYMTRQADA